MDLFIVPTIGFDLLYAFIISLNGQALSGVKNIPTSTGDRERQCPRFI
jgi:hypothetical protein